MGGDAQYGLSYYTKAGFAGGVCCSVTHGAMCPVDVVKTRMQLEPQVYNKGRNSVGSSSCIRMNESVHDRTKQHLCRTKPYNKSRYDLWFPAGDRGRG